MKKFFVFLALIGILGIVLACGILAENETSSDISDKSSDISPVISEESTVSIESITAIVSVESKSSDVSSKASGSTSSKRYGAGATDPTGSVAGEFGDPVNNTSLTVSEESSSKVTDSGKKIFNLSQLFSILIFIPIACAIGAVAALVHVNKKSFLNDDGKKSKKAKNIRNKK